jgi:IS5 family transposase
LNFCILLRNRNLKIKERFLKLFSFLGKNNLTSVGVETDQGTFDLTRAFDIYQQAKRVHQPVSFAYLQVMVEMGYFSKSAVQKIFSDPWVQSKTNPDSALTCPSPDLRKSSASAETTAPTPRN